MRGDDGMHARRSGGPADRAESDRLLDAARAGTPPVAGADPLTRLLSAAAGPAAPGEVAGEERALAVFRAARAARGTQQAAGSVAAPRARRRLRIAAALSGLAATAVAGVAFAAVRLDREPEPVAPPATTAGPSSAGPSGTGPTGTGPAVTGPSRPAPSTPAGDASGAASPPAPSPTPAPSGTPSAAAGKSAPPPGGPQTAGHCRAYLAKSERQREKALTKPGYAELVAAAGGPEQVESYCRNLLGVPADDPADAPEPAPPGPAADG
ncbi:hypothetical protein EEZ25_00035 [Micromonospora aurantiaca]|uniref:hypothetical protein n=2 Tax=Micromonospora aurantiaca (nom. illeg.) TaxID=47850 RepID=UPI000F3F9531|nr:hypothetical protein [Micromonospora aurantiaca]RNI06590.1 hypothetical protein EEZ25_00035 [Micromonospora aurantiaca]